MSLNYTIQSELKKRIEDGKNVGEKYKEYMLRYAAHNKIDTSDGDLDCCMAQGWEPRHILMLNPEIQVTLKWTKKCQFLLAKIPLGESPYEHILEICKKEEYIAFSEILYVTSTLEAILEDFENGQFGNLELQIKAKSASERIEDALSLANAGEIFYAGFVAVSTFEAFAKTLLLETPIRYGNMAGNPRHFTQSDSLETFINQLRREGLLKKQSYHERWVKIEELCCSCTIPLRR